MTTNFTNVDLTKYFEDIDFDNFQKLPSNKVNNYDGHINKRTENCTSCGSSKIMNDTTNGIIVCTDCGQVLDDLLDYNPEWKHYEDDDKNNGRCGVPINKLLPQSSLGTSIAGNGLTRLKMIHSWNAMPYRERSLNYVFKSIQEKCAKNKILKCVELDAQIMYKTVSECKHLKGKNKGKYVITRGVNRVSIIAACVFFACRRKSVTRTPKEIADIFKISCMEMNRGCKNFLKMIKIKKFDLHMGTCSAEHFVRRYCNQLHIKTHYADEAVKLSQNIEKLNIASAHTPYSIAAACILLMANINKLLSITKKKLSQQFNVSEVTIAKTYKKIEPYRDIIVDTTATEKIWKKVDSQKDSYNVSPEMLERMKKFGLAPDGTELNKDEFDDDISEFDFEEDEFDSNDEFLDFAEDVLHISIGDDMEDLSKIHAYISHFTKNQIAIQTERIKDIYI